MAYDCTECPLNSTMNAIPLSFSRNKEFLLVTKPPSTRDVASGSLLPSSYGSVLDTEMIEHGFNVRKDFNVLPYIRCSYDKDRYTTAEKRLISKTCRANMADTIPKISPTAIVPLGADATSAVAGRKVKITKVRGVPVHNEEFNAHVLPILDPAIVNIRADNAPLFKSDVASFARAVKSDFRDQSDTLFGDYTYIDDIGFIVDAMPDLLCIDTETESFNYFDPNKRLLTIQFCYEEGKAYTLSWDHPDSVLSEDKKDKVILDLRRLIRGGVKFVGHNLKYDSLWVHSKLGVALPIDHDTLLMYSLVDENSYDKSLSVLTKRYIPELAGYDDKFNLEVDKAKMAEYPLDNQWLNYASCDTDACFRVTHVLLDILRKDRELLNYYNRVTMPGINGLFSMEKDGILVDVEALHEFRGMLSVKVLDLKYSLLNRVPRSIRRKHMTKGLAFTRAAFLQDILFDHKDGFRFKPQVFTDSTKNLPDKSMRKPSVSTKLHLPYFIPHPFVEDLIEYIKLERMLGTNVINYEEKYIHADGMIHPTHFLSTAVTGRVSSKNPNCFPPGTEVLTENGWERISEICVGTKIAQWGRDMSISFATPTDTIKVWSNDSLVHIHTDKFISVLCTKNHRFSLTNRKSGKVKEFTADQYPKDDYLQPHAGLYTGGAVSLNKHQVALICAIQADGHVHKRGSVDFIFIKQRKCDRILRTLDALGIPYSRGNHKRSTCRLYIRADDLPDLYKGAKYFNKSILDYDLDTLRLFATELWHWDGDYTRHSTWTSIVESNADWVQIIYALTGARAYIVPRANANCKRFYCVNVTESTSVSHTTNMEATEIPYTGYVYCFTMPLGSMIVRHQGKIAFTLNSQNAPSRGALAKAYKKIYNTPEGYGMVAADYSQMELRIAAHEAQDREMIRLYNEGADIHAATAAVIRGLTLEEFYASGSKVVAQDRQNAKGCIAEGSMVRTARGPIAIERILDDDLVYDGDAYVSHGGVEYQGDKYVMEWSGVTATPDHFVVTEIGAMPLYLAYDIGLTILYNVSGGNSNIDFYYDSIERVPYLSGVLDENVNTQYIKKKAGEYGFRSIRYID